MQKTGRIARNEILSVFNKLNMTFLSSHSLLNGYPLYELGEALVQHLKTTVTG